MVFVTPAEEADKIKKVTYVVARGRVAADAWEQAWHVEQVDGTAPPPPSPATTQNISHDNCMVTMCEVYVEDATPPLTLCFSLPPPPFRLDEKEESSFRVCNLSGTAVRYPNLIQDALAAHGIYRQMDALPVRIMPARVVHKGGPDAPLYVCTTDVVGPCRAVIWWAYELATGSIAAQNEFKEYIMLPTLSNLKSWCVDAVVMTDVVYLHDEGCGPADIVPDRLQFAYRTRKSVERKAKAMSLLAKFEWRRIVDRIELSGMDRTAPVRLWYARPMDRNIFYPTYLGQDAIQMTRGVASSPITKYRGAHGGLVYDATAYQLAGFMEFVTQMLLTVAGCFVRDPLMRGMNVPLAMPFDPNVQSTIVIRDASAMVLEWILDDMRVKHETEPHLRDCFKSEGNNDIHIYSADTVKKVVALMRSCIVIYKVTRTETIVEEGAETLLSALPAGKLMIVDVTNKEYAKSVMWVAPIVDCLVLHASTYMH